MDASAKKHSPERIEWPDVAKGIGILLVVFGHCWRGIEEAGLLANEELFHLIDRGIYLFHMPLFFFLSGWFYPSSIRKHEPKNLLSNIFFKILYPLILWNYIFIFVKLLAGSSTNNPVSTSDLLALPIPGYLHLWFLWALALIQISFVILRPILLKFMAPLLWVLFAMTSGLYVLHVIPNTPILAGAVRSVPFFVLGALWATIGRVPKGPAVVALLGFAFLASEVNLAWLGEQVPNPVKIMMVFGCVLFVVSLSTTTFLQKQSWLVFIGRCSMTIYLCHTIVSATVRIVLVKLGIANAPIHLVVGVLAGVLLPLLLHSPPVPTWLRALLGIESLALALKRTRPLHVTA